MAIHTEAYYRYEVQLVPTSSPDDDLVLGGHHHTLAGAATEARWYASRGFHMATVIRLADGEPLREFTGSGKPAFANDAIPGLN